MRVKAALFIRLSILFTILFAPSACAAIADSNDSERRIHVLDNVYVKRNFRTITADIDRADIRAELAIAGRALFSGDVTFHRPPIFPNHTFPHPTASGFIPVFSSQGGLLASALSVDANGNISLNGITNNGITLTWPSAAGLAGSVLTNDGNGNLYFSIVPGSGNVSTNELFNTQFSIIVAAPNDGPKHVMSSDVTIDVLNNVSGINTLTANTINGTLTGSADSATTLLSPLAGDVTGLATNTMVAQVGGQTAANIASATLLALNATNSNIGGTLIRRNVSGDISVGTVTATALVGPVTGNITGNVSGNATTATSALSATTAVNFSGNLNGNVTGTQGATVVSQVGGQSASNVAAATLLALAATASDTANNIVRRDSSSHFTTTAITLTGTATNPTDAVTKEYVDSFASLGIVPKAAVDAVADSDIALSGLQTIDGVSLIAGQRVLTVNQTNSVENGFWVVDAGAWTRPTDFPSGAVAGPAYAVVLSGTTYGGSSWLCATPTAIIDTDPITMAQFSVAGQITGANVGTEDGKVFRDKTGATLNFKSIGGDTHLTITNDPDDVIITSDATASAINSTIVSRDGSGNFEANIITAALTGAASENVLKTGDEMTGTLSIVGPAGLQLKASAIGNSISVSAPNSVPSPYALSLPPLSPTDGQVLQAFADGTSVWAILGGTPITTRSYYVSQAGDDAHDGSLLRPFRTVQKALLEANTLANTNFPISIVIGSGIFNEDNSGGPLTITADGISIYGSDQNSTIITPLSASNALLFCTTGNFSIENLTFLNDTGGSNTAVDIVVANEGNGLIRGVAVKEFGIAINIAATASDVPSLTIESAQFFDNETSITNEGFRTSIKNCSFIGDSTFTTPLNVGITTVGEPTTEITSCSFEWLEECISNISDANSSISSCAFTDFITAIEIADSCICSISDCWFKRRGDVDTSPIINAHNTGCAVTLHACHFLCAADNLNRSATAIRASAAASITINACFIQDAATALFATGSNTTLIGTDVYVKDCNTHFTQANQATVKLVGGIIDPSLVSLQNPSNISVSSYSSANDMKLAIGNQSNNADIPLLYVLQGAPDINDLPGLIYKADHYGAKGIIYENNNAGEKTVTGVTGTTDDVYHYIATGDRTKLAALALLSDTSTIGDSGAIRGWQISKTVSSANLAFDYSNDDATGQALRGSNTVMELSGLNNEIHFPVAVNAPTPANTTAKLTWGNDTSANLYRSDVDTLRIDGALIIGALTANRALATDANKKLVSSSATSTELGYLSGVTSSIQTQLDSKLSNSGGTLTLAAGTAANPSLQFTGSTNTGLSAATSNRLAFSTNGSERLSISSTGTISINGFSTAGIVHNSAGGALSSSLIINTDIDAAAAIADSKLATITTSGKVANSATTATSSNTADAIVARDSSGNFSAGTVTASLTGAASLNVLKAGDTMSGTLTMPAGTAAAPSIRFSGSLTSGLSSPAVNTLALSTNGTQALGISSAGIITLNSLTPTAGVVHNNSAGVLSSSLIANADIDAAAAIADSKLATITTSGKVANSATTATSSNTADAIVARDSSGNFSAGTITAALTGAASLNVLRAGDTMSGALIMPAGTAAAPSIRFTGSTTSGLSAPSANTLALSTNGSQAIGISSAGAVTLNSLTPTAGVVHNSSAGLLSSSLIVNADIDAAAAIADSKLATITTSGKVSNSATTATSSNTASAIVARDGSGNFSAGTITASLTGAASLNVLRSGDTMSGTLTMPAGTAAAPSIRFSGSTTSGVSSPAVNTLALSTNGSQALGISSAGIITLNSLTPTAGVVHNSSGGVLSSSLIVNADIDAAANIADSKLATITTSGKVANSATTATTANTPNTIVLRDGSGNISMSGSSILSIPSGSVSSPSLQLSGAVNTGLAATGSDELNLVTNGTAGATISTSGVDINVPLIQHDVEAIQALQVVTPTSGSTINVNADTSILLLTNASNVINVTVNFPAPQYNGQRFTIMLGTNNSVGLINSATAPATAVVNAVTSLSLFIVPTATTGGSLVSYLYYSGTNAWYRAERG